MKKIILRKEAKAKGLKVYFTGKACINGHIAERRTSSYECVACERIRKQKHIPKEVKKTEPKKPVILKVLKNRPTGEGVIGRNLRVVHFAKRVGKSYYAKAYQPVIVSDTRQHACC